MTNQIPIVDLKNEYRAIKHMIDECVLRVLSSGSYILGREVEAFERDFSFYLKSKHTIGVNSGTDALYLALKAFGIGKGDEVITTPSTFIATAETIHRCGATPVFADVQGSDSNIDPDDIERKITGKTRAILPVHLYGFVCDMDRIRGIAEKHGLKIIEDCAQAVGAYYGNSRVGTLSDAGCFSFYPTKNLGAYGDAGCVVTADNMPAERVRILGTHGSRMRGHYDEFGINSRLDEIQAAILRVKLLYIDRWNSMRRKLGDNYDLLFADDDRIGVFKAAARTTPVRYLYCILTRHRDTLQERLAAKGIASMVHYPVPLHLAGAFKYLKYKGGDLPVSESISNQILALPLYPELSFQDQEVIAGEIKRVLDLLH